MEGDASAQGVCCLGCVGQQEVVVGLPGGPGAQEAEVVSSVRFAGDVHVRQSGVEEDVEPRAVDETQRGEEGVALAWLQRQRPSLEDYSLDDLDR